MGMIMKARMSERTPAPASLSVSTAIKAAADTSSVPRLVAHGGRASVCQVQIQMNARSATLLTDDERNTLVEQLPARCVDQAQAFELLINAVSGWNAHVEVNRESHLLSIEHAGHVVVCTVPKDKNASARMCVKLKWEQGTKQVVRPSHIHT